MGERGHHLQGQCPPSQLRRGRHPGGAVRGGGPQRRRGQPRRAPTGRGPAHLTRDHHRRQGHPGDDLPAARRGRGCGRSVPQYGRPLRRVGCDRRIGGGRAGRGSAGAVRLRPVAVHRPGRGRLRGGERAVRTGGRDAPVRPDGRGSHPGAGGSPPPERGRQPRGDGPGPLRRRRHLARSPRGGHRRDHHPGHRPGGLRPLPPEGAPRRPCFLSQDPPRKDRDR